MRELIAANRRQWDERTALNVASSFYDVDAFKAGRSTLRPVELDELGEVSGKRLLHLQCHFGLDSLSWARRGAEVTGVDFSETSIVTARHLAAELGLRARFVCSDVYELANRLSDRFDIVFTSYGVLAWLPDLPRWAQVAARFLDDDGVFYIVEEHPMGATLVEEDGQVVPVEPYFDVGPIECPGDRTYVDVHAGLESGPSYQWQHSLSDVVNAVIGAGLRIEFVHEFPFCSWQRMPSMRRRDDGYWHVAGRDDLPLLFSLRASVAAPRVAVPR